MSCPASKDRVFLWDDALSGFGLAAFPSGKKVYVAQFRSGGRSRRVSIGEHGRLTPDEARSLAKQLLGSVESGADPAAARRAARKVRTFAELAADFIAGHIRPKRKPETIAAYERALRLHILPSIGRMRMDEIGHSHLARMHLELRDRPLMANKCMAIVSSTWAWAEKHGEPSIGPNPVKGLDRYKERRKERFLSNEELLRLGDALRHGEAVGYSWQPDPRKEKAKHAPKAEKRVTKLDPFAVAAIRLLILTGARLREILHARWSAVDFERGMIHLPDSKTGAKPLYLSAAALALLAALPRVEGNPHVIPGERPGAPRSDLKKPWAAVTKAAGLRGLRLHDLRHSFASIGAGASLGLPVIGRLLGHSQPQTTARYAHLDADPLRRAADAIGATIAAAMNPDHPSEGVVLPFSDRKQG